MAGALPNRSLPAEVSLNRIPGNVVPGFDESLVEEFDVFFFVQCITHACVFGCADNDSLDFATPFNKNRFFS